MDPLFDASLSPNYLAAALAAENNSTGSNYELLLLENSNAAQPYTPNNFVPSAPVEIIINKDEEELRTLLKSWNMETVGEQLIAEKVFVNILKIIKPHHIGKLLKNCDFGTQILFEYNLEQWRTSIGVPLTTENNTFCASPTLSTNSPRYEPYPLSRSPTPTPESSSSNTANNITLANILNETPKGKNLAELYNQNSKFNEDRRKSLITVIAQFFDDKDIPLNLQASYRLENEVLERFPTEKLEYYRTAKRGKLYNKYINLKSQFRSTVSQFVQSKTSPKTKEKNNLTETRQFEPEEDAEGCIRAMKFDNLSVEEFDTCWKACAQYRLKEIQQLESTTIALEKWGQYKLPSGYRLVDMDFSVLYKTGTGLLDSWQDCLENIIQFLCIERHVKDKSILELLETLKTKSLNENSRDATLFYAIHGYLVPTQKIVKKNNNTGKKDTVKFTIRDSQVAFLYIGKSGAELEDHLTHLKNKKEAIQPFVMCIGDNVSSITEIYVFFDDVKYKFSSLLRAVDICFKIFYVFNLKFPAEATIFWTFIETYFFKIKSTNNFSKVHILIEALKTKNTELQD